MYGCFKETVGVPVLAAFLKSFLLKEYTDNLFFHTSLSRDEICLEFSSSYVELFLRLEMEK